MKSIQSWRTIRRVRGAVGSAVAVAIAGLAFGGEARGLVGYYDMIGEGNPNQEPPILTAGETPVLLQDLTSADLAGLEVLFVQNDSNGNYGAEYLSRLSSIQSAVENGMNLIIHDRLVSGAETILPGGADFEIIRDFGDDANIDILDYTTLVTNGPGGVLNDGSLDGGNSSSHGFSVAGSLPEGAAMILSRTDPGQIVTMCYGFGAGSVTYSTIPLDFYLNGDGSDPVQSNMAQIYAPNVVAYGASGGCSPAPVCSSERIEDENSVTFQITATDDTGVMSFGLSGRSVNTVLDLGDFEGPALEATIGAAPIDASLPFFADVIASDEDENTCQVTIGAIPQFDPVIFPTTDGAEAVDVYSGIDGELGPHSFAFLAAHTDGVYVLDVTDPTSIVLLGVYNPGTCFAEGVEVVFDAEDVTWVDEQHALYVSAAACGMHFVNADPNDPLAADFLQLIGIYDTPVWAQGSAYVMLDGKFVTFVADDASLEILDTTNLATPFLLSSVGAADDPFNNDELIVVEVAVGAVDGDIFSGIATDDGMRVVQITSSAIPGITPSNPMILDEGYLTPPEFSALRISQDVAVIPDPDTGDAAGIALPSWAAGIQFLGIDDEIASPYLVQRFPATDGTAYFSAIAYGDDVFATEGTEGLRRFSIDHDALIMPVSLDPTATPIGDGLGTEWAWDIKVNECISYTTYLDTDDDTGGLQLNSLADCLPTFLLLDAFSSEEADDDGDGFFNSEDNCTAVANPDQFDSDADGYGNACDADFDNDGLVGASDFIILSGALGSQAGEANWNPDVDFNHDSTIGALDFVALSGMFGSTPGPSGLSCAGKVPCP